MYIYLYIYIIVIWFEEVHDLNDDGLLQESELIMLNVRIAMLHHDKADLAPRTHIEPLKAVVKS